MSYYLVFRRFIFLSVKFVLLHTVHWIFFKKNVKKLYRKLQIDLTEKRLNRIYYYSIMLYILFDWMVLLRKKRINKAEKYKRNLLMIFTPSFDDLGDEYNINADQVMKAFKEEKTEYDVPEFIVAKYIYKTFLSLNNLNAELINQHGDEVVKWECSGKTMEINKDSSYDELKDVIIGKGGDSIVFYRAGLDSEFKKGEEKAYFKLGSLLQFTNDIFDVYKDVKNGHQTLLTTTNDLIPVYDLYVELINDMIKSFFHLDLPIKRITKFLNRVMIILSRGLVCFNQLLEVQNRENGKFAPAKLSRQDLVCDMEKWSNIKKSIKYCAEYQSVIFQHRDLIKK